MEKSICNQYKGLERRFANEISSLKGEEEEIQLRFSLLLLSSTLLSQVQEKLDSQTPVWLVPFVLCAHNR